MFTTTFIWQKPTLSPKTRTTSYLRQQYSCRKHFPPLAKVMLIFEIKKKYKYLCNQIVMKWINVLSLVYIFFASGLF